MKTLISITLTMLVCGQLWSQIIADHTKAKLNPIPESAITQAKSKLHIAYGHTSHGSQIIDGMTGLIGKSSLVGYKGNIYQWNEGGSNGALDIDDYAFTSDYVDLGQPDKVKWESLTRTYLNKNTDVNVVMWSWCGQLSYLTEADVTSYLNLMQGFETSYPNVHFVYMTGHLDGTGETGNLHLRNQQIRTFCKNNNKILYDFADIESYDPDGNYYLAKAANDNCDYDNNSDGNRESNWATAWQNKKTENVDWYSCTVQHSKALNGNLKAYAAWWLWARLAGWNGGTTSSSEVKNEISEIALSQNYPNPSDGITKIKFDLVNPSNTSIKVFDQMGAEVMHINLGNLPKGTTEYELNTEKLASGLYYYQLSTPTEKTTKKMIIN